MIDVLLIHPPITDFSINNPLDSFLYELQLEEPLGICYIGAVLRENGYSVKILDMDILKYTKKELFSIIKILKPRLIGFGINSINYIISLNLAKETKNTFEIPILFGGVHATIDPIGVISHNFIDFVIVGEGEYSTLELVENLLEGTKKLKNIKGLVYKNKDNKIILNSKRKEEKNLDNLPFPARDLIIGKPFSFYYSALSKKQPIGSIITNRGCPYNCTFCSKIFSIPRFRSAENIVDEITWIKNNLKINDFQIMDETFNLNQKMNIDFCNILKKEKLDIFWRARCRPDLINDNLLRKYSESDCYVITLGVESGSDRILELLNKGYNTNQINKAFKKSKRYNLETHALFMMGIPGETTSDLKETIKFIWKLSPNYLQVGRYTGLPGSKLYDQIRKYRYFEKEPLEFLKIKRDTVLEVKLPNLSKKLINKYIKFAYIAYLTNPNFIKKITENIFDSPFRYPKQISNLLSFIYR